MFKASIALAVAAIPEGLPAVVTITLAIGVGRMAKRRAVIRKLPAVEALGSTTVICTDKTGTLTENQMTVQRVIAGGVRLPRERGRAMRPRARSRRRTGRPAEPAALEVLRAGLLCNDSRIVEDDGRWDVRGDPTEGALETAALKAGLDYGDEETRRPAPRRDPVRVGAPVHGDAPRRRRRAPDRLRQGRRREGPRALREGRSAASAAPAAAGWSPLDADAVHAEVDALAADGLRVLAFARGEVPAGQDALSHEDVAGGLVFLGPAGDDRPAAAGGDRGGRRLSRGRHHGQDDHRRPRRDGGGDRARRSGRGVRTRTREAAPAVTGAEMAQLHDKELIEVAARTNVFARVTPEQKLRLVEALQATGNVVAMTGDGVNDAPALKQADIGVAMGITGTDVAKEAADMVLTDDNFASIEAAVEEGRGVFDNLVKFIAYALPTNVGQGLVLLTAIVLGVTLPILPLQILWINMTTAVLLGLGLAFEAKEPGIMARPPRRPARRSCRGRSSRASSSWACCCSPGPSASSSGRRPRATPTPRRAPWPSTPSWRCRSSTCSTAARCDARSSASTRSATSRSSAASP